MTTTNELTPEKILEYRLRNKLTQANLAELLGMSRSYVAHIENGSAPLTSLFRKKWEIIISE
jgi:transcriptional regulator with XRE-family HTH domain